MWIDAFQGKFESNETGIKPFGRNEFDKLLGHWGATTDMPQSFFAKELIEAYPEAKVILVERDVDSWYRSYEKSVIDANSKPFIPLVCTIDTKFLGGMAR